MYEFTLKEFLLTLRSNLKRILVVLFISVVVGLVIAFSIPKQYSSTISLAPEPSEDSKMGGMGGLASLAGIDLGQGGDAIGPDLYPDVVATNSFLVDLLQVPVVTVDGDSYSFQNYMISKTKIPWWGYGKVLLIKAIKALKPAKKKVVGGSEGFNPKFLSEEEDNLINGLRGCIGCQVNEENGVILLSVNTQDPLVSTIMVDTLKVHLQDFITEYRTNKARVDLEYYLSLQESAKKEYELAKQMYSDYCDSHQGVTLQSHLSERETLENELQLAFNAYSQVKQQVLLAQAKVQENTPAFTVLEESSVPNRPDSPRKMLILFACVFVGCFGYIGWIYFKLLFSKNKHVNGY